MNVWTSRGRRVRCAAIAALGAMTVSDASAQVLRVRLSDSVSGGSVIGALVAAIDAAGAGVLEGVTDGSGGVSLRVSAPGPWRARVRRIGHRPFVSPIVVIPPDGIVRLDLNLASEAFTLPQVDVAERYAGCSGSGQLSRRAGALWEQVTVALRASALSTLRDRTTIRSVLHERELDLRRIVVRERVTGIAYGIGRPFGAINPDSLAAHGYVRREADGGFRFYAPDDSVLVSTAFLSSHCLVAVDGTTGDATVRLDFWPRDSTRVADIAGAAFVDSVTGDPRRIAYRYTTPAGLLPTHAPHAGGDITLGKLSSGEWIVSGFSIRMPLFSVDDGGNRVVVRAYRELAGVAEPARTVAERSTASATRERVAELRLRLVDELGRPVPAVEVTRAENAMSARSDQDGVVLLSGRANDRVSFRARKLGYAVADTIVSLDGNSATATLVLRRVQRLATDSVMAARARARVSPSRSLTGAQVLDAQQIQRRPAGFALDLLQGMPGMQLYRVPADVPPPRDNAELSREWFAGTTLPLMTAGTSLNGRGGVCLPALYVDARRSSVAQYATIDTREVIAVEVYPRGAHLPPELQRGRDDVCGAVAIWTVYGSR